MPSRWSLFVRIFWSIVITAVGILIMDAISSSLTVSSTASALVASVYLGILNAIVAPALTYFTLPLSIATLGLGAIMINGSLVAIALVAAPGIEITSLGAAILIAMGLTVLNVTIVAVTAIDDDYWFDNRMRRRASKNRAGSSSSTGTVFVQIDGLAYNVLKRAMRNGNAPNLLHMVHRDEYSLRRWQTDWSSQTGASQAGILLGSNENMPAFRWVDKPARRRYVSNHPADAEVIEADHTRKPGLLAEDGAGFGNLFTGGAGHGLMIISAVGKLKSGGFGSGYGQYFSRPYNATRTSVRFVACMLRELVQSQRDKWSHVEPSVPRGFSFAFARAFTSTLMTDVCVTGAMEHMAAGRSLIYLDLLSYDEVAHHCGVERPDALLTLRDIDRQIARMIRFERWVQRPYQFVVLSDHGQSAGIPFAQQFGETLAELIERSTHAPIHVDDDGKGEATSFVRPSRHADQPPVDQEIEVLCSGNLGLVYFTEFPHRLNRQQLAERWPALIKDLVEHPGVGFVLVADENGDGLAIGKAGTCNVTTGNVEGNDPLQAFGPRAREQVRRSHSFTNVADLMINAEWDPIIDMTYPFENFVGSHGGMGGDQGEGFVIIHRDAHFPDDVLGAEQLHALLEQHATVSGARSEQEPLPFTLRRST